MNLTIEMDNPERQILYELGLPGITQRSVAITYAFLIAKGAADWTMVNSAIENRWKGKTALERIKTQAWEIVEQWQKRARSKTVLPDKRPT